MLPSHPEKDNLPSQNDVLPNAQRTLVIQNRTYDMAPQAIAIHSCSARRALWQPQLFALPIQTERRKRYDTNPFAAALRAPPASWPTQPERMQLIQTCLLAYPFPHIPCISRLLGTKIPYQSTTSPAKPDVLSLRETSDDHFRIHQHASRMRTASKCNLHLIRLYVCCMQPTLELHATIQASHAWSRCVWPGTLALPQESRMPTKIANKHTGKHNHKHACKQKHTSKTHSQTNTQI